MADLEANFMHLQLMHESLSRFSESFAGFLYGMNMNAFCVDFLEAPVQESFRRAYLLRPHMGMGEGFGGASRSDGDGDATFL
jgi:DASH complex subunit DAM1